MAIPLSATGSLSPTFVPAPPVGVAVKPPSAFALSGWFPSILRGPLGASDTLSEATAPVKLPAWRRPRAGSRHGLGACCCRGGIPTAAPHRLAPALPCLPPILYVQHRAPAPGWSKAPWGLSVLARVASIFTGTSVSPDALPRQRPGHYAFRAGRNLPDKEFRYLRTVIVTAAVYWGLGSGLRRVPPANPSP